MTDENQPSVLGRLMGVDRRRSRCVRRLAFGFALVTACLILMLFEGNASASPEFPGIIEKTWSVPLPWKAIPGDGCKLCHANDNNPDPGKKVATLVGVYFHSQQLAAGLDMTLKALLAKSKSDGHDSDQDGVSDYQELVNGTNPNVPDVKPPPVVEVPDGGDAGPVVVTSPPLGPPPSLPPLLQTGCSVRPRLASSESTASFFMAIAVAWAARRRRAVRSGAPVVAVSYAGCSHLAHDGGLRRRICYFASSSRSTASAASSAGRAARSFARFAARLE